MGKRALGFMYERFCTLWCILFLVMFSSEMLLAEHTKTGDQYEAECVPQKPGQSQMDNLSKTEAVKSIQKLRMPFIANQGQMDEKVTFYANTFGGTVFVTNEGEIVYALPKSANDDSRSQDCRGELRTPDEIQRCRGELHSPDVIHDGGCGIHENRESYIKSCSLGEACPEPVKGACPEPVEWAEHTQHNVDRQP